MFKKSLHPTFLLILAFVLLITSGIKAEINFDFGLPLYKQSEINFEKNKSADYNFQLLKKYILEHKGNVIAQYQAILRWFTLIKLSDTPRQKELLEAGNKYFSLNGIEQPSSEDKLRHIFYTGVLIASDKKEDEDCTKEKEFEDILLNYDDELKENADYWIAKGILFQSLKNRSNNYFALMKPEEDLKSALTLIPKTSQYYYVMGQCFRFLGNSDSALFLAIASYEKASSLDPRNSKLQNTLISIYMGLHEEYQSKGKHEPFWLEEAVYKKIVEIAPNNPYALNNLGYLYAEYGVNTNKAVELCKKAVMQNPNSAGFQDSLGWAAFKNKEYKVAENALLNSISLRNNVYESHYHLATLYYATDNYQKAIEQYELAIKLRPDSAEALNNLAYLYTELDTNAQKALSMAKTANQLEPNNASYLDTLGWAYYRNGDLDNALIYLQKANNIYPAQSEILLHIGRIYLEKSKFDDALTFVKEAFKANPNQNDPDETLYLTIRLKALHEAMANYHGILGEKADKDKVLKILKGISLLYQEEGLYEKSIEITKICAGLNSGEITLKEPLLDSYTLVTREKTPANIDEKPLEKNSENETIKTNTEEKDKSVKDEKIESNESKITPNENNATQKTILPQNVDCPVAISFCSDFFKLVQKYFPNLKGLINCNVTIILDRLLFAENTVIVRVSSDSLSGKDICDGIQAAYGCFHNQNNSTEKIENKPRYIFPLGNFYFITLDKDVYISKKKLTKDSVASFSEVLPYRDGYFMEFFYDNKAFHKRFPDFANNFVRNPFYPFEKLQASYQLTNDGINEFIVATTGKVENDDFMKKLAARLFRFKVKTNKKGLTTTIKMKSNKDMIYISTEFENLFEWLTQKVNTINKGLMRFIPFIFKLKPAIK